MWPSLFEGNADEAEVLTCIGTAATVMRSTWKSARCERGAHVMKAAFLLQSFQTCLIQKGKAFPMAGIHYPLQWAEREVN